jgi:hypothetical protein
MKEDINGAVKIIVHRPLVNYGLRERKLTVLIILQHVYPSCRMLPISEQRILIVLVVKWVIPVQL